MRSCFVVQATARGYEKSVEELKRRKRGRENEARMVAIYLGRQLGGHKHEEIGKTVGLGKASSVSSAYLLMKERVATEKQRKGRVWGRTRLNLGSFKIFVPKPSVLKA
jgi:chromosomal replication initiation ATPase DnaA